MVGKTHRHRWYFSSSTGDGKGGTLLEFRCRALGQSLRQCEKRQERKATAREAKLLSSRWDEFDRPGHIHSVWHKFCAEFLDKEGKYRWVGYDLMGRIERWAKGYPTDVRIVSCDDSVHSSSDLILIEHQAARRYMGTTVVYVPQNGFNMTPQEFFLYPGHREGLIKVLVEIRNGSRLRKRKEAEDSRAEAKIMRKWKP